MNMDMLPHWDGLPYCDKRCPQRDGEQCRLLGYAPRLCDPLIELDERRLAEIIALCQSWMRVEPGGGDWEISYDKGAKKVAAKVLRILAES